MLKAKQLIHANMKLLDSLPDNLADWIRRQPVFFTGSAPTHGPHINVSPKGCVDSHFAILGPNQCAYIDRTGSGCETISHSYENGRLCIMFMSFGSAPRILRLFCRSSVVEWDCPGFQDLVRRVAGGKREAFDAARAVILCDIWQVQTSCGYGVPRVKRDIYAPGEDGPADSVAQALHGGGGDPEGKLDELCVFEDRPTMDAWAAEKVQTNKVLDYQGKNNVSSLDGLPGLRAARRDVGQTLWVADAAARARRILAEGEAVAAGFVMALLLFLVLRVRGVC